MPLPQSGTYYIINEATGRYLDLYESITRPGNPLIGWTGHEGTNQRWLFEKEGDIFTLTSLVDPSRASARSKDHIPGSDVVVGDREQFQISEVSIGRYRLSTRDQNLVWTLRDGSPGTHVQLQPRGFPNDIWIFRGLFRSPDDA